MPLLELTEVEARYGQVRALHGLSLTVDEGEVVALLGANGAGKTTTLRAISGSVARGGARGRARLGGKAVAAPARGDGAARGHARARGPRDPGGAVGLGEPAHGRVPAARPGGDRARPPGGDG